MNRDIGQTSKVVRSLTYGGNLFLIFASLGLNSWFKGDYGSVLRLVLSMVLGTFITLVMYALMPRAVLTAAVIGIWTLVIALFIFG
jgi:hypothetical protein